MSRTLRRSMKIAALGDVHWKEGMSVLREGGDLLAECDLVLLAGDITDSDNLEGYGEVIGALKEMSDADIIAVFGNEEYEPSHPVYRSKFNIRFLEDERLDLEVEDVKLRMVGSTGSVDRPTWWQRNNIPDIWKRYKDRMGKIEGLLERGDADVLILLTHYAPTYATLDGEKKSAFPEMGSLQMEKVILEKRPDLAIHAHAHRGKERAVLTRLQRSLEDFTLAGAEVVVHNVSLPTKGKVTVFDIRKDENGINIRELQG